MGRVPPSVADPPPESRPDQIAALRPVIAARCRPVMPVTTTWIPDKVSKRNLNSCCRKENLTHNRTARTCNILIRCCKTTVLCDCV